MTGHTAENDAPDPYDEPIWIRSHIPRLSHMHAEPVCAFPECETYLTRDDMRAMRAQTPWGHAPRDYFEAQALLDDSLRDIPPDKTETP